MQFRSGASVTGSLLVVATRGQSWHGPPAQDLRSWERPYWAADPRTCRCATECGIPSFCTYSRKNAAHAEPP
eukprot:3971761-Alexandrium_andersonii.AAC.1